MLSCVHLVLFIFEMFYDSCIASLILPHGSVKKYWSINTSSFSSLLIILTLMANATSENAALIALYNSVPSTLGMVDAR